MGPELWQMEILGPICSDMFQLENKMLVKGLWRKQETSRSYVRE